MAIRFPESRSEINAKLQADVKSELPNSNPQLQRSWLSAVLAGFAGSFFDIYFQLRLIILATFDDTTFGEFLQRKAAVYGIVKAPATLSQGNILLLGTPGSSIPISTQLTSIAGDIYLTKASVSIVSNALSVASLTYAGQIATVTTDNPHGLASGVSVTISGATPGTLNETAAITVLSETVFQYNTAETGSGTATGTILVNFDGVNVAAESQDTGADKNLDGSSPLTLSTPIAGVDNTAYVDFGGMGGGADSEDDDSLRSRLIFRKQNPVSFFNEAFIKTTLLALSFVDRVFVQPITPAVGQVTIYLLKEDNGLPSSAELQIAEDTIKAVMPAHVSISSIFINAPTPLSVNFDFSAISPDTTSMRTAVTNQLTEFFKAGTSVGEDLTENEYISVIQNTIDTENGASLDSFTLTGPVGDIVVTSSQIALLGTIAYA
jgi:uncharacterized phage protein gp47/JayE